jgi:hypothetical protein
VDDGAGKKGIGAVLAAVIAALGIGIARGGDDCAMAACRGASHGPGISGTADDALRLGRVGSAAGDEGVVLGRGGRVGSSGDDLAGLGIGAAEEGAHARGAAGELAEAAAENVVYEVVTWNVEDDEGEDGEGEDLAPSPQTHAAAHADRLLVHLMVRDPALVVWDASDGLTRGTALTELGIIAAAQPLWVAAASLDDGSTLALGNDQAVPMTEVHRRCWELGRSCIVFACAAPAESSASTCLMAVQSMFHDFEHQIGRRVITQSEAIRRILSLRDATGVGRSMVISRIALGTISHEAPSGTPRIVVSRQP